MARSALGNDATRPHRLLAGRTKHDDLDREAPATGAVRADQNGRLGGREDEVVLVGGYRVDEQVASFMVANRNPEARFVRVVGRPHHTKRHVRIAQLHTG